MFSGVEWSVIGPIEIEGNTCRYKKIGGKTLLSQERIEDDDIKDIEDRVRLHKNHEISCREEIFEML